MRNIKISDKFKEYFNVENRTETILKSITVVACTLSVILILFMLLSGESSGHNSSYELDSSNGSGYGRPREGQSDTEYTGDTDTSEGTEEDDKRQSESSQDPDSEEDKTITLSLTDNEASDLASYSFSERLPIHDVNISFFSPDTVKVKGTIAKSDLGDLFAEQDLPLVRAALILAPEELKGELVFSIALSNDGSGTLTATPERVLVNNINVTHFIPPSAVESANKALSSLIPENTSLRQIIIEDGSITFTLQT
ncbi:MAG: hypothetical protein ACOYBG_00965 [Eubacteriales bacterium]